ncbi:DUF4974 domain-containing protein [Pedobacter sp. MC2016-14]|uniref:FecR family protein n=1 Tax=Pedobacter sp. MC2016-14 TaxID=2897327 RepID=UPI001E376D55|nr:FecR family protein [Pedobacter sp. MC2016-14]MCD0488331.1 DUF4974 domain-containing protein [Pedobacter sp. MC2016-14]
MQQEKQPLQELITKHLEGQASPEEEKLLQDWLQQYHAVAEPGVTESMGVLLKKRIDLANGQAREAKVIKWLKPLRYAAASIIVLIAAVTLWHPEPNVSKARTIHFSKALNSGTTPRTIHLNDGSTVNLESGAELVWQVPFAAGSRKVELHGKAFFSIAKDKQRPFSVYAGNISTTALGTSFWVDDSKTGKRVQVKLITGKVVIKEHAGKFENTLAFLKPGQELSYNAATRRALVNNSLYAAGKTTSDESIHSSAAAQLIFDNTPLNEVLNRLQQFYHVKINYNVQEIKSMSFYGEFSAKDKVQNILNTIAIANELNLKRENNTFTISK